MTVIKFPGANAGEGKAAGSTQRLAALAKHVVLLDHLEAAADRTRSAFSTFSLDELLALSAVCREDVDTGTTPAGEFLNDLVDEEMEARENDPYVVLVRPDEALKPGSPRQEAELDRITGTDDGDGPEAA